MIENFVLVSSQQEALTKYNLKAQEFCFPIPSPSVLSGGDFAWVITSKTPDTLQSMKFGFTSEVSEKRMDLLNLRTDESEREDEEDEYDRLMRICLGLTYSASFHSCRCAVLVDGFLVSSPDNTTYLIHMQNKERPFALAGIYANWFNKETKHYETGFLVITTAANPMLRRIGVDTMPVILLPKNVIIWLDLKQERRAYLPLIHTFPDDQMNGYPVSGNIFLGNLRNNMLQPIGQRFKPELVHPVKPKAPPTIEKYTMPVIRSYGKRKERGDSTTPWFENRRKVE